jgi:hypothetical protein
MGNQAIANPVTLLHEDDKETAKLEMQLETPMEEEEGRGENLEMKMPSSMQKETLQEDDKETAKLEMQLETPMEEEEGRGENLEMKMQSSTQNETLQQVEALMESKKAELDQEVVEIMTEMQVETSTEEEGEKKTRNENAKSNANEDSTAGGGIDGVKQSRARAGGSRDKDGDGGWKKKTQNENAGCEDSIADDREHEQKATGEETREKNSSDEKEGSKHARALDKPRVPAINLHYDALVPNGHIDSTHLNKLMGYKIKTSEQQEEVIEQWQDWKKEVRVRAAYEIKKRMKLEALKIPEDDNFTTPTVEGRPISKFLDIKKWWANAPADCLKSEATFSHLAYGMWEKFWERNMEEAFMVKFGWSYDQEVKERAQKECGRAGYVMKGCVAKKHGSCEGGNSEGSAKKGVGKQIMEKQSKRGEQKMRLTLKMATTLRGRRLPSRLLRWMIQMMTRNLQQLPRKKETSAIT